MTTWLLDCWYVPIIAAVAAAVLFTNIGGIVERRIRKLQAQGRFTRAIWINKRFLWWTSADIAIVSSMIGGKRHPTLQHLTRHVANDAAARTLLASLRRDTGDLGEAERLLDRALANVCKLLGDDHPLSANVLSILAAIHLERGDSVRAQPLLQRALQIEKETLEPDGPRRAITLTNVGNLYYRMGDYPAAARSFEEARDLFSPLAKKHGEQLAEVLNNLGSTNLAMGDLPRAGETLRQAVEHSRTVLGERHRTFTMALLNLGQWHEKSRQFDEAVRLIQQAAQIQDEVFGPNHTSFLHALNNLGFTLSQTGDYAEAGPLIERVLAGHGTVYGDNHPLRTYSLGTRALIDAAIGRPLDALARFRELAAIDRRVIAGIFTIASDAQRLTYLGTLRKRFFYFLSLVRTHLAGDPAAVAEAYDLVLTRKALAAEATAARRDAVLGGRYPHLTGQLRELTALRQQIAARMLAEPGTSGEETHARLLTGLQQRQTDLEIELARSIPEIGLELRLLAADRRAVAAALPAGAVLVEFVRFDLYDFTAVAARGEEPWKAARYLAFVVRAANPDDVSMIDLGEADETDSRIRTFRSELLGGDAPESRGMAVFDDDDEPAAVALTGSGIALRVRVFDPLRQALGAVEHLILAPDGELAILPFEVLPGAAGCPLIDEYRFSYLAVGRDILRAESGRGRAGESLVIAGPDFDLGSAVPSIVERRNQPMLSRDLDRSSMRFPPLPGTLEEGRAVAMLLGVEPAIGAAAVESRLKAASPRVLHIATHGFFLPDQRSEPDSGFRGAAPENPLLRSGLALAGANTWLSGGSPPTDAGDGLLTAEDVTGLDLSHTDLVVLSACETGLGEVRAGEGVFGLRRAFQLAGARAVVMSLWKVPDEPTRELMAAFYRHLLVGLPRVEALRRAQRELKARYPDPRYWGAFILQGDTGPLRSVHAIPESASTTWPRSPKAPATSVATGMLFDALNEPTARRQDLWALIWFGMWPFAILLIWYGFRITHGGSWFEARYLLTLAAMILLVVGTTYHTPSLLGVGDRLRCRKWRLEGTGTTTEGELTDYRCLRGASGLTVSFRIGEANVALDTKRETGGFHLNSIPGSDNLAEVLTEGTRFRVRHHENRILQLEIIERAAPAEPEPFAPPTVTLHDPPIEPSQATVNASPVHDELRSPHFMNPRAPTLKRWLLAATAAVVVPFVLPLLACLFVWAMVPQVFERMPEGSFFGISALLAIFSIFVAHGTLQRLFVRAWHRPPDQPRSGVSEAGLPTHVLYDVLDDRPIRMIDMRLAVFVGITILLVVLFGGSALIVAIRGPGDIDGYAQPGNFVPSIAIAVLMVLGFAAASLQLSRQTISWRRDQALCKDCQRRGDGTTVEGLVTKCQTLSNDRGPTVTFRLADSLFSIETNPNMGGLCLGGVQGTDHLAEFLASGERVRLTHREGRILRLEWVPGSASGNVVTLPQIESPSAPHLSPPVGVKKGVETPVMSFRMRMMILAFPLACGLVALGGLQQTWKRWSEDDVPVQYWSIFLALGFLAALILTDRLRTVVRKFREVPFSSDRLGIRIGRVVLYIVMAVCLVAAFALPIKQFKRVGVESLAFTADGLLAAGCVDGRVRIYDPETGKIQRILVIGDPSGRVVSLVPSPDGKQFFAPCVQRGYDPTHSPSVHVTDAQSGAIVWSKPAGVGYASRGTAWSPAGGLVAWAEAAEVKVAAAETGDIRFSIPGGADVVAFSPDGRRLAIGGSGQLRVWDVAGRVELFVLTGHPSHVTCLAWSPDGERLASGGATPKGRSEAPGDLRLWDTRVGRPIAAMPSSHQGTVTGVAFAPDGRRFASVSSKGSVLIWDGRTGEPSGDLTALCNQHEGKSISWSAGGRLAVAADDVFLIDPVSRVVIRRIHVRPE